MSPTSCDPSPAKHSGETVEAAIIVSVLLSFVEQLMLTGRLSPDAMRPSREHGETSTLLDSPAGPAVVPEKEEAEQRIKRLIKRMRIQIWAGTLSGLLVSLALGAAFIAVVRRLTANETAMLIWQFYTKFQDLWGQTEQIWEGVFSVIACIIIYIMGVAFLKMDRSRIKWAHPQRSYTSLI